MEMFTSTPRPELRLPLLVVIMTTPFAASEPYSAEAEAPFRMERVAMSSGLTSTRPLELMRCSSQYPFSLAFPLRMGTPSIITSGWLLPVMELSPRTLIDTAEVAPPGAAWMRTPGVLP